MALKLRLTRRGMKKVPFYRVVVSDTRSPRDGRFLEVVGTYDPKTDPPKIKVKLDRVDHWVGQGARLSDTVSSLVNRARKQAAAAPSEAS